MLELIQGGPAYDELLSELYVLKGGVDAKTSTAGLLLKVRVRQAFQLSMRAWPFNNINLTGEDLFLAPEN